MSYLTPNDAPNVVPLGTLQQGDVFVISRNGLPTRTMFNLVATYGDVSEAETFDGRTRVINKRTLVYKI